MQVEQWRAEATGAMTFDEVSMERSKSFVKALQELKNLRPQLYSAAEYCEKSYLHNEQKQMVLDNLKGYVVRALVNAVDHLGTVAYKLTDLYEQQTVDVSNVELKISSLNQQFLTCQTYTDKEGLRQQRLLATTPRHHKHYILPSSINKKVRISPQVHIDAGQNFAPTKHSHSQGTPISKTLSWHLASESNSTSNGTLNAMSGQVSTSSFSNEVSTARKTTPEVFHLLDAVGSTGPLPLSAHLQSNFGAPQQLSYGSRLQGPVEVPNSLSAFTSLENPNRQVICRPAVRNKSVLSVFFAKNKHAKQKRAYVS